MAGVAGGGHHSAAVPRPATGTVHRLVTIVVVGGLYYLGGWGGLELSLVEHNVTPLWPPTGIAVAAFLVCGRGSWPGVAVAAFAVNVPNSETLLAAAVTAAGNTLAPLVAVTLLGRLGFRRQLDRGSDALELVFVGALGSMLLSATVGTATLVAWGTIPRSELVTAWSVWWTGDAMGVLVVAPFLLSLTLFGELPAWTPAQWVEAAAAVALAGVTTAWAARSVPNLLFLTLPVLAWAAWRLQLRGTAPAALAAALVATWSATRGVGTFDQGAVSTQMFTLQAFNASVALTSFFLAAMVSERHRAVASLSAAADELEERVAERTAELSAANARVVEEVRERSLAQAQLSHEEARARREHEIAETLQRSLLPEVLPRVPGVRIAARYVPASGDVEVGGDWYDVLPRQDGLVGLAIGDVAGHGLAAAATMGQLRMALRAYALQDPSPAVVMAGIHRLVAQVGSREMVTLTYLVLDPVASTVLFSNAGHPPPLVSGPDGSEFLQGALSPLLGVTADPAFTQSRHVLRPGETLLLYTDGLVERRDASIQDGLDRLARTAAAHAGDDVDTICDRVLGTLLDDSPLADDVALMVLRLQPSEGSAGSGQGAS